MSGLVSISKTLMPSTAATFGTVSISGRFSKLFKTFSTPALLSIRSGPADNTGCRHGGGLRGGGLVRILSKNSGCLIRCRMLKMYCVMNLKIFSPQCNTFPSLAVYLLNRRQFNTKEERFTAACVNLVSVIHLLIEQKLREEQPAKDLSRIKIRKELDRSGRKSVWEPKPT